MQYRSRPNASDELHRFARDIGFLGGVQCSQSAEVADFDIHFMATQCDVLVAAASSFSLSALLFSTGSHLYSPVWPSAVFLGLFSHFDQSGVRPLEDLLVHAEGFRNHSEDKGHGDSRPSLATCS